jgi:hypothetical protein
MLSEHRARAILKIKKQNTASVQTRAKIMVLGIGSQPTLFATVTSAAGAIQGQIPVLDKAETVARTRAPGSAAARNVQRKLLVGMMESAMALVQAIADAAGSVDQAVSTIQEAGLVVAMVPLHTKAILTVTQGPQAGSVVLDANATVLGASGANRGKKTCFHWQSTSDGKTYVTLPSTPTSKTSVSNLTPLTTYGFRVCVTIGASARRRGAWEGSGRRVVRAMYSLAAGAVCSWWCHHQDACRKPLPRGPRRIDGPSLAFVRVCGARSCVLTGETRPWSPPCTKTWRRCGFVARSMARGRTRPLRRRAAAWRCKGGVAGVTPPADASQRRSTLCAP